MARHPAQARFGPGVSRQRASRFLPFGQALDTVQKYPRYWTNPVRGVTLQTKMSVALDAKLEMFRATLRAYDSCVVAYSGGVDSTFLAWMAMQELHGRILCVMVDSPLVPRAELTYGIDTARRLGLPLRLVKMDELELPGVSANPPDRCFVCKAARFRRLIELARAENYAVVVHGENASDHGEYRPGAAAAAALGVQAPLKEAGLTKPEIRELSQRFGLPTAGKPAGPCLATRIPYGEEITPKKLVMIEQAEAFLTGLGFTNVRVRHHVFPSAGSVVGAGGAGPAPRCNRAAQLLHLARIEVDPSEVARLCSSQIAPDVSAKLRELGYQFVTVDLVGYRRGCYDPAPENQGAD